MGFLGCRVLGFYGFDVLGLQSDKMPHLHSGADILCLHPRTQKQMFGGHSNWEHIRILKQALNIPLIGSGDIDSPETAFEMLNTTGCDALMIGRCALGKPWLFRQITDFFNRGDYFPHH